MKKRVLIVLFLSLVLLTLIGCASTNGFLSSEDSALVYREFLKHSIPNEKIYVIGHKSPDTDTVGSAVAYANLLNCLGYDCEARISGKASNETKYVFELCNMEIPSVLEDATDKNIILVDNNEPANAVSGIKNSNMIAVVDHHLVNPLRSQFPIHFEVERTGATASIIAADYQRYDVKINPQIAKLLALTIMADTSNFTNAETTEADKILFKNLCRIAGLSDCDAIYANMKKAKESYDGMTEEEIYHSDYKEYEVDGQSYSIGYVRASGEEALKSYSQRMLIQMEKEYKNSNLDFLICQVADRASDVTYISYYGPDAEDICKKAFSDIATFENGFVIISPSVSRKTVLAPRINDALSK